MNPQTIQTIREALEKHVWHEAQDTEFDTGFNEAKRQALAALDTLTQPVVYSEAVSGITQHPLLSADRTQTTSPARSVTVSVPECPPSQQRSVSYGMHPADEKQ